MRQFLIQNFTWRLLHDNQERLLIGLMRSYSLSFLSFSNEQYFSNQMLPRVGSEGPEHRLWSYASEQVRYRMSTAQRVHAEAEVVPGREGLGGNGPREMVSINKNVVLVMTGRLQMQAWQSVSSGRWKAKKTLFLKWSQALRTQDQSGRSSSSSFTGDSQRSLCK